MEAAPEHPEASGPRAGHLVAERYRLIASIGAGAFGEVWDADDLVLGERVALKLLRAAGPESAQTRREIATLRLLRFPGVVRLLDEGDHEGRPFFVTERVQGSPFPGIEPAADSRDLLGSTLETTEIASAVREAPFSATVDALSEAGAAASAPRWKQRARESLAAPGGSYRYAWSAIAGVAEALLHTLRRVHAAGIVHRDLKPANVLVRPDGRPVVLDFGLCLPTVEGAGLPIASAIQGTPAYLSPEQARGGRVDARADLYAVGVMLYEALTGCLPHDAQTIRAMLLLRASQRAVPVRARDPSISIELASVVDGLLAVSPADRPASAAEVLERLHGGGALRSGPAWSPPDGDGPHKEPALRRIFGGRDRLFHLREDAAAALHARTGGDPALVRVEIERWLATGWARCDGGKLFVDRDTLDRWEAGLSTAPLAGSDSDKEAPSGLQLAAEGALARARGWAEEGRLGMAAVALEEGLLAARRLGSSSGAPALIEAALLAEWVKVAFAERRPHELDRVLYEVCRAHARSSPEVSSLEALLRAGLTSTTQASLERAAEMAERMRPFEEPALERWRYWIRVRGRMLTSPAAAEEALAEADAWAAQVNKEAAHAAVAGFRGAILYVEGKFEEAAGWHGQAASVERWVTLRIAQMLNEAAALLEAHKPARARVVAERAAALAAASRHAHFEGRAAWVARTAAYRVGEPMTTDLELVEAHAELGVPESAAAMAFTEAAIAFRSGDREAAAELAARAADTWQRAGQRDPAMLARALAGALGGGLPQSEAEGLAALAAQCAVPGIGIQALGLLKWACPALRAPASGVIASLCAQVPVERWRDRIDVLSVEEARAALLASGERPAHG